jgi:hypothetical protein
MLCDELSSGLGVLGFLDFLEDDVGDWFVISFPKASLSFFFKSPKTVLFFY